MQYHVHITMKSGNAKTGPIPVSTSSAATCPTVCPFKKNGCYADGGPLALHWAQVTQGKRGTEWSEFCATIEALPDGQLWRHNQAGDLPGDGTNIDAKALRQLIRANNGKKGFTYTHYPLTGKNADIIAEANQWGFTINLSANNLQHADELADANIGPVVVVLPADATKNTVTPAGRRVVVCPATIRDNVSCTSCGLCARERSTIIGFPAHGSGKKRVEKVISIRSI